MTDLTRKLRWVRPNGSVVREYVILDTAQARMLLLDLSTGCVLRVGHGVMSSPSILLVPFDEAS